MTSPQKLLKQEIIKLYKEYLANIPSMNVINQDWWDDCSSWLGFLVRRIK